MQDRTINNALEALRAKIIRERLNRPVHVDALLRLRRHKPAPVRRKMSANRFCRNETKRLVCDALGSGPMTGKAIAEYIAAQRPDVRVDEAYGRVYGVLVRMKAGGLVVREGRLWGLAP